MELHLIHEGEGRFRCADKTSFELASAQLDQGQPVRAKISKPRSLSQHSWFFAMIDAAYENQRAGPQFPTSEHLRKWLLVQADWCHVTEFDPNSIRLGLANWLSKKYGLVFTSDGEKIYAKEAKSIAFKAADGDQMTSIANRVMDIICERIVPGTSRADWEPFRTEHEAGSRPAASRRASARSNRPAT